MTAAANVQTEMLECLKNFQRDMRAIRLDMQKVINYMVDAEAEVPEKMRRFIMYYHDMHDIMNLYVEHGHEVPAYILREVERCDDRLRHILKDLHENGGTFDKVRRDMTERGGNRYDHTKLIAGIHKEPQS